VRNFDNSIERLVDNMFETMHQAYGVGLAAPQVGVLLRVIVIEVPGEEAFALVNPEVVRRSGERQCTEGCLSLPGYRGETKRSVSVTVKGYDHHGKQVRLKAEELLSQALEHEIDHLNGVLYIDHLENKNKLYQTEATAKVEEADL